jgi:hypothetical protein
LEFILLNDDYNQLLVYVVLLFAHTHGKNITDKAWARSKLITHRLLKQAPPCAVAQGGVTLIKGSDLWI